MVRSECFLDCLTMTREQIDAEHPSVGEDVAASVPITLSEEGDQLLDAGLGHGEIALFLALLERDLLAEGLLKQMPQIG